MKCKKCGATARDIDGMRRHYLKKHPGAMKRRKLRLPKGARASYAAAGGTRYCPHCGMEL